MQTLLRALHALPKQLDAHGYHNSIKREPAYQILRVKGHHLRIICDAAASCADSQMALASALLLEGFEGQKAVH